MTMSNNDMVALFPDVINCMQIPVLEIKKMCFLYLQNYARAKPDIALRALPILQEVYMVVKVGIAADIVSRTCKTQTR